MSKHVGGYSAHDAYRGAYHSVLDSDRGAYNEGQSAASGVKVGLKILEFGLAVFPATAAEDRVVVIGENMMGRVIPAGKSLGAKWYKPGASTGDAAKDLAANRAWIRQGMKPGRIFVDVGPERGRASYPKPTSPFYKMEVDELRGYSGLISHHCSKDGLCRYMSKKEMVDMLRT